MSDHGFTTFDRAVNLNTWLMKEGFLTLDGEGHINWSKTKAYAMGLNAPYVNLAGREEHRIVPTRHEQNELIADLIRKLQAFHDPVTNQPVIIDVTSPGKSASRYEPDLVVGYAAPYRASWERHSGASPPP